MNCSRTSYELAIRALQSEDDSRLEELERLIDEFPGGKDEFTGGHWIINAIALGSKVSVAWMLRRNVDIAFQDKEGYTVLHAALERSKPDRHEVLEMLLRHGAPTSVHGINDWTPMHLAAAREDIEALRLLLQFGADPSIRTRIDEYATPLEEARHLGKNLSVHFLEAAAESSQRAGTPR
jgi:ankyrin repeat protein